MVKKEKESLLEQVASLEQLQKDIGSLRNENKGLKEQIDALEKYKAQLESDLNKAKGDNEKLIQDIKRNESALKEKPSNLVTAEAADNKTNTVTGESKLYSIDLPPIVVSAQGASDIDSPFALEGKILNVNTEYNFVVIDLGQDMGVKKGMVFEVSREGKLLGKIEVIEIRPEVCACDITKTDFAFKIGDTVRY